jgi:hypothetical protein
MDAVLEPTREKVLKRHGELAMENKDPALFAITGYKFFNASRFSFRGLLDDPEKIAINLKNYVNGFSRDAREIIEHFNFHDHISRLDRANLLYLVVKRFADPVIDLHPDAVSNIEMGYIFEELIRRFAEQSNETAGEHFTPREVIKLMVHVLFAGDAGALSKSGVIRTLYDPAAHGRDALRGGDTARTHPRRAAQGVRAGDQQRVVRHLQGGHVQGRTRATQVRHSFTLTGSRRPIRLYALQPALRVEWKIREGGARRACRKVCGRLAGPSADQRTVAPIPPANEPKMNRPTRARHRHRLQGLAALQGDAGSGESNIRTGS